MKTINFLLALLFIVTLTIVTSQASEPVPLQNSEQEKEVNYADVRIKNIPISMQCWTFRKFTFLETLQRVNKMGIKYLQAYPGQKLSADLGDDQNI